METYNIKKNEAVKILESFGYKTASDFSLEKLQEKINQLSAIMEETQTQDEKIPENILKRVDTLLTYQSNQIPVVIEKEQSEKKGTNEMKKEKKKNNNKGERKVKKMKEKNEEKILNKKNKKNKKSKLRGEKEKIKKATKVEEKSNKQLVYEEFLKVKPKNAGTYAESWYQKINKGVKIETIRCWISDWKAGRSLPKGAKKK